MALRCLCLFFLTCFIPSASGGFVIGAYDSVRAGSFSVFSLGISAIIESSITDSTVIGTPELTDTFLQGIDVLLLTSNYSFISHVSPLTASERSALLGFIMNGGGVVATTSDAPSFTEPFDVVIGRDSGPLASTSTVPNPSASPVTDGPFGIITTYTTNLFGGVNNIFSDLGSMATPIGFNGHGSPTLAVIEESAYGPGSGRVVLFADPETALESLFHGNGLVLNAIVYVAVPEVSASMLVSGSLPLVLARRIARRTRSYRRVSA